MSDWKYTFEHVQKTTWLAQIAKDLYPRNMDSMISEWWPGETVMPFRHPDDRYESIRLPNSLFMQPARVMEWIDTSGDDAKSINRKVLNALNFGAQSIVLHVDEDKKIPVRLWIDGVFSEMIELSFSLNLETPEIIHAIREIIPPNTLIRLNRKYQDQPSSVFLEGLDGTRAEDAKYFRFIYEFPGKGEWTSQTASVFRLLLQDLTYWVSQGLHQLDFLENCILRMTTDMHYLKQIIQTRVLHLVWNNLWSDLTNQQGATSSYLECHIFPDPGKDPDKYLIWASSSALAASLTGVHTLCIHHLTGENIPDFYPRIDRNLHHLLNLEGEIYKGTDPIAGSYDLDFYAHHWTQEIWNQLFS